MKKLIAILAKVLLTLGLLVSLALGTIYFQLLNPVFLIESLDRPDTYQRLEKSIRLIIKTGIENSMEKQGLDLSTLTIGERAALNDQIGQVTSVITAERIKDFSEENISRIANWMKNDEEDLFLYLPLGDWGVVEEQIMDGEPADFSENTSVKDLLQKSESDITFAQISSLKNFDDTVFTWFTLSLAIVGITSILVLLTTKEDRIKSFSTLFMFVGIFVIFLSLALKFAAGNLASSYYYTQQISQLIIATMIPPILESILAIWISIGAGVFITGIILYVIVWMANERNRNLKIQTIKGSNKSGTKPLAP